VYGLPVASVDGKDLQEVRRWARLTRKQAAERLGVTRQTVWAWETGRTRAPYPAFWYLSVIAGTALPGGPWRGWALRGDALVSPAGQVFRVHELAWLTLVFAKAREFDRLIVSPAEPSRAADPRGPVPDRVPVLRERELSGLMPALVRSG
jgi:transcriptional regulator with XRE-family HTH domain